MSTRRTWHSFGGGCQRLRELHANEGSVSEETRTAVYHELGRGVQKDEARAVELYQQSCDDGDELGCYRLGRMLERGRGVAADVERAAELYRKACQGGRQEACEALERLGSSSEVP